VDQLGADLDVAILPGLIDLADADVRDLLPG
jgi:hypothetical protein